MHATRRRDSRPFSRALGAALTFLWALCFVSSDAHGTDNGAWSMQPSRAAGATSPRSNILLFGAPGQTIRDAATLTNLTDEPIEFEVYPADAFTNESDGAFSLRDRSTEMTDLGSWIQLQPELRRVSLAGGASIELPFDVVIPSDAEPGDHAGGIVALNLTPVTTSDSQVNVEVLRAVGVRTYLRVSGATAADLELDLDVSADPSTLPGSGSVTATYVVTNTGNVRVRPAAMIRVDGAFTHEATDPEELPELLPGASVRRVVEVDGLTALGRLDVQLAVSADGVSRTAERATTAVSVVLVVVLVVFGLLLVLGVRGAVRGGRRVATMSTGDGGTDVV